MVHSPHSLAYNIPRMQLCILIWKTMYDVLRESGLFEIPEILPGKMHKS